MLCEEMLLVLKSIEEIANGFGGMDVDAVEDEGEGVAGDGDGVREVVCEGGREEGPLAAGLGGGEEDGGRGGGRGEVGI